MEWLPSERSSENPTFGVEPGSKSSYMINRGGGSLFYRLMEEHELISHAGQDGKYQWTRNAKQTNSNSLTIGNTI